MGLIGNSVLLVLYLLLIGRGLMIAANASTCSVVCLAASITLSLFTHAFINMGHGLPASCPWSACRCPS